MINRLSNAINRNRSAAKISKVMSSSGNGYSQNDFETATELEVILSQLSGGGLVRNGYFEHQE